MQGRSAVRFPIFETFSLFCRQTLAIVEADVRKLRHDPTELVTRMIQPAVWLLIFGQAMSKVRAIPTGSLPYLDYMAPGILAQSVIFVSIFYGISLIWERDLGILHKILVTPAPRSALVFGRALSAGIRSIVQVFVLYPLSWILGVHLRLELVPFLGVIAMVVLGAALFATLSLIVASIVRKRERFLGVGQVLTMPLFFASNALYPVEIMPGWIQVLSILNPLTYQVDALRYLMVVGAVDQFGLATDFLVTAVIFLFLVLIATRTYPKILY